MNNSSVHSDINLTFSLVKKICRQEISQLEVEQFAHICLRLAIAYLQTLENCGKRIRETDDKREFDGIAADCIADLFIRDEQDEFIYLCRYFKPILIDSSSGEIFIALRKLIASKVQQYLTKIYRERDPEGAKLLRNVRLSVRRHKKLKLVRDTCGEFILFCFERKESKEIIVYRPSYSDLDATARYVFQSSFTVDQMVLQLMDNFACRMKCDIEIELLNLVKLIRTYRDSIKKHVNVQKSSPVSSIEYEELAITVRRIIQKIEEEKVAKYIRQKKLTLSQGLAMQSALRDIANNSLSGDKGEDNYNLLKKHWPALTREQYMSSVRKIFEYLVRQFREAVSKELLYFPE